MRFKDRADAGTKLAEALARYRPENPIVLALSRGGVPVATQVASALSSPLDILLVRKVISPIQQDLTLGAIADGGEPIIIRNPHVIESTATSEEEFKELCRIVLHEIERQRLRYVGERIGPDLEGRVVIVIDDGVITGTTMRAALRAVRARRPKKLIVAVPVAIAESFKSLRSLVDDAICLTALGPIEGVRNFYDDFRELTDRDVLQALGTVSRPQRTQASSGAVEADSVRRLVGDLDAVKTSAILALDPTEGELEQAAMWAAGNGDLQARAGRLLAGKAAAIFDIITAGEEDEPFANPGGR
jgi:putative phosphoribosyl transferase